MRNKKRINTRTIFIITLLVIALTIIFVWLLGLDNKRTIVENSIISTCILFVAFSSFLTIGLYRGIKLNSDIEIVAIKLNKIRFPIFSNFRIEPDFDIAEGFGGIIISILLWIVMSIVIAFLLVLIDVVFWFIILAFIVALYWIFFRALHLVFNNSNKCKDKLLLSLSYGFGYSTLYISWIFALIIITEYLTK